MRALPGRSLTSLSASVGLTRAATPRTLSGMLHRVGRRSAPNRRPADRRRRTWFVNLGSGVGGIEDAGLVIARLPVNSLVSTAGRVRPFYGEPSQLTGRPLGHPHFAGGARGGPRRAKGVGQGGGNPELVNGCHGRVRLVRHLHSDVLHSCPETGIAPQQRKTVTDW